MNKVFKNQKGFSAVEFLLTLIVIIIIVVAGWYVYHKDHKDNKTVATSLNSSVIVFDPSPFSGNNASTTSIVDLNGTLKHSISSSVNSDTYNANDYSSDSADLFEGSTLITANKAWSNFAILNPDGQATPIASSLSSLLAGNVNVNSANTLSGIITIGGSTMLALESPNDSPNTSLIKVNLLTGAMTTLFTAVTPLSGENTGSAPLILFTTSSNDNMVYLFAQVTTIGSTNVSGASLVSYNLLTNKITFKTLPSDLDSQYAAISNNGNLVAYLDFGNGNTDLSKTVSTDILNITTGKNITVPTAGLTPAAGGLEFSLDGKYLAEVGDYPTKNGMELQIISTSSDTVTHKVDLVGSQYNGYGISGGAWANNDTYIYTTNSSTTDDFTSNGITHGYNASTGDTYNYSKNLGELLAVLNYQQ